MSDSGRHSGLDTSMLPLGERAWRAILEHVVAAGDAAETAYLEVKGPLEMSSKSTAAKVAKFLLGTANRLPREAVRSFRGHAVLVIGATKGAAEGVPKGTEAHELEDRLRPYLSPQFPAFEMGRLSVDAENEVLFLICPPPQEGQPPFPCHKDFQSQDRTDSLTDGAIYVRGRSNTRPARAGEVLALVERARGGNERPPIELRVEVDGSVHRVVGFDEVYATLRQHTEKSFAEKAAQAFSPARTSPLHFSAVPADREAWAQALANWRQRVETSTEKGRQHLLGTALKGMGLRVTSTGRFVEAPELRVIFHDCELVDHLDAGHFDYEELVEPILKPSPSFGGMNIRPFLAARPRDYPVTWENHGTDAVITLTPASLRPDTPWETSCDDYVVLARDPEAEAVHVTWSLTEKGGDSVTRGELEVPTSPPHAAKALIESMLPSD